MQTGLGGLAGLIKEAEDLATSVLPPSLLVIHDTQRRCQNDVPELTGREQVDDPLLNLAVLDVEARADHAAFVDATNELNHNLTRAVVIHNLELSDVACIDAGEEGINSGVRR